MAGLTIAYDHGEGVYSLQALKNRNFGIISGTIDFDASYPTGGEAFDLSGKMQSLKGILFEHKAGYTFQYDYGNKKVLAYYADYDAAADGALIQVADATNLSAVTGVRFFAYGYV